MLQRICAVDGRFSRRVQLPDQPGVKFAEARQDCLRAKPERRRPAGMPGRAGVGEDLQVGDWRAGSLEQGKHFGLGVESIEGLCLAGLPAARAALAGEEEANRWPLRIGEVAPPDLKEAHR